MKIAMIASILAWPSQRKARAVAAQANRPRSASALTVAAGRDAIGISPPQENWIVRPPLQASPLNPGSLSATEERAQDRYSEKVPYLAIMLGDLHVGGIRRQPGGLARCFSLSHTLDRGC